VEFYTYLWLRYDGTPYCVGKGKGNRAYDNHSHRVNAPVGEGRILVQEFPSEEAAFVAEKFLISYYGRLDIGTGCLRNRTDGGEGLSNPSPEARQKMSRAASLRTIPPAHKEKLRVLHLGTHISEETREKMRGPRKSYKKRRPYVPGSRRSLSLETRQRMSCAAKRRQQTEEGKRHVFIASKLGAAARWQKGII
jgi:hypothetical protein